MPSTRLETVPTDPAVARTESDPNRSSDRPSCHRDRLVAGDTDIVLDNGAVSSIWWATKNEWLGLIDIAGLKVEAVYGDFNGTPLTADSRE